MNKLFKYISIALFLVFNTGCSFDDLEINHSIQSGDAVTVLGRVMSFSDCDVTTRGSKSTIESTISSMAIAIFPVNDAGNGVGPCAYYQYMPNQSDLIFNIERGGFNKNKRYAIYVFANMPEEEMSYFAAGSSLDDMLAAAYDVTDIYIPEDNFKGFPMIGSIGDTFSTIIDKDDRQLILAPTSNGTDRGTLVDPQIIQNGTTTSTSMLSVPMTALYAKVNFTIVVDPDQEIEENKPPQFTLSGYTVYNIPSDVDLRNDTNSPTKVIESKEGKPVTGRINSTSTTEQITFTFYLPERLFTPTTTADKYDYPFDREEDILKYRQRYKGQLPGSEQKATNVVFSGTFRDHQEHSYNVDYTIHLGADNFGDFNILRNREYKNTIIIRGIQASKEDNKNTVYVDHRVNVEHTQPAVISLHREVLLDSHFEIRPLRIKKNNISLNIQEGDKPITHVKVNVLTPTTTNWMRIERSFGDGTPEGAPQTTVNNVVKSIYIDDDKTSPSYGKRRFFTYNLIDGENATDVDATLKDSTEVILPLTDNGECVWIYVDECSEIGDDVRSGVIKLTYGYKENNQFQPSNNAHYPDINYTINQRKLFPVTYTEGSGDAKVTRPYNIEYEEEYLHNFDSEDNYGETEQEGMKWGLEGVRLSYDHEALYFKAKTGDWANGIVDYFTGDVPAYYDFYIKKHDEARMADPKQVKLHEYAGYDFCDEIITDLKNPIRNDNTEMIIDALALNEQPNSAIEYCYNKNKRNNKGIVENVEWYLPAIDEMEEIVMSTYESGGTSNNNTYARFIDFQNKFYWSSQPAFIQNYAHMSWVFIIFPLHYYGTFYYDDYGQTSFDVTNDKNNPNEVPRANIGSARATKVKYNGNSYDLTLSGTNGHYSYYDADDDAENIEDRYKFSGTYGETGSKVTVGSISREEGNLSRRDMARVRCVRKQ